MIKDNVIKKKQNPAFSGVNCVPACNNHQERGNLEGISYMEYYIWFLLSILVGTTMKIASFENLPFKGYLIFSFATSLLVSAFGLVIIGIIKALYGN